MVIPNHVAPSLSPLDLKVISHIRPGGNWKDVPESVPSKRLETIRQSYARGEGSRSTYYGRLTADAPAYTINTYFTRPGNGCHIHFEQSRTLSYREAARFQSFPDDFVFAGPKTAQAKQIGNAVPPLLSFRLVDHSFAEPGGIVDLFSGAGGLSLGAVWAGWEPIVGNDIEAHFLETYSRNIHKHTVLGDIRDSEVRRKIVEAAHAWRRRHPRLPLMIVGGPPCQGFSTAGKVRSMDDERNHLFREYRRLIESIGPDYFIFENVTGLLNMAGGSVFRMVMDTLDDALDGIQYQVLHAHQHGVPQRRSRIVIVGGVAGSAFPEGITDFSAGTAEGSGLPTCPGAQEALGDLPSLEPGEDGTFKPYVSEPSCDYQAVMRGETDPRTYIKALDAARRDVPGQLSLDVKRF